MDRGYDFVWQVLKLSSIEEFVGRDLFSFRYGAAVARFPAVFILGAVIICILKNNLKQRNTIFPFGKFTHPLSNNEVKANKHLKRQINKPYKITDKQQCPTAINAAYLRYINMCIPRVALHTCFPPFPLALLLSNTPTPNTTPNPWPCKDAQMYKINKKTPLCHRAEIKF